MKVAKAVPGWVLSSAAIGQVLRRLLRRSDHLQRFGTFEGVQQVDVELDDGGGVATRLVRGHLLDAGSHSRLATHRRYAIQRALQVGEVTAKPRRKLDVGQICQVGGVSLDQTNLYGAVTDQGPDGLGKALGEWRHGWSPEVVVVVGADRATHCRPLDITYTRYQQRATSLWAPSRLPMLRDLALAAGSDCRGLTFACDRRAWSASRRGASLLHSARTHATAHALARAACSSSRDR